jgi:exopolyphosphatase/guanosine-5'-triphosphate,3'-diphosphate pyrophosphatase
MRAAIDIGTNTVLLLIVDEARRPIVDLCRFGRLGKGLDASGRLSAESIARSLEICREYRRVLDDHGIDAGRLRVVGTQALREAVNAAEFVEPAEHVLGSRIEVIEGTREAELEFRSVAATLPALAGTPYVVVDVGGGSTEVIVSDGRAIVSATSLPIGAVRLADRHAEQARMERDIDGQLARLSLPAGVPLVATSGTATTLASLHLALQAYDSERVTGVRLSRDEIGGLYARLLAATVEERIAMPGMEPGRADVVHAGVAILVRLMRAMDAAELIVADRGVRWGLVYE